MFLVLLAILLAALWFFNPEDNYEPVLALIGLVLTYSEVLRRRASTSEVAGKELAAEYVQDNPISP